MKWHIPTRLICVSDRKWSDCSDEILQTERSAQTSSKKHLQLLRFISVFWDSKWKLNVREWVWSVIGCPGCRWRTASCWGSSVRVELRSASSSRSWIRYEPLRSIRCSPEVNSDWCVCCYPPGSRPVLLRERWPPRAGRCRGERSPWRPSCSGAARRRHQPAVRTVRRLFIIHSLITS